MGFLHRFTSWIAARTATFDGPTKPIDLMFAEMFRTTGTVIGYTEAMSVPAVQRGRNMLCSIATLPLVQLNSTNEVQDNPLFRQIDPDIANVVTLTQTVEDLIMHATSYWQITARDFNGFPTSARHVAYTSVTFRRPDSHHMPAPLPSGQDPRGAIPYIDGIQTSWSELIRFDSPNPGILAHDGRVIRQAIALSKTAELYGSNPRPLDYFTPADGAPEMSEEQINNHLGRWAWARRKRATAFVPNTLKYNPVDSPTPQQMQLAELQKQVWLELANALGLDPEDLGVSTTSRTYQNAVDRRRDRINEVYAPYMRAITDRLSMGDVTRRGHRVQFDLNDYLKSNPTEQLAVDQGYLQMGVITVDEIRASRGLPPLPAGAEPATASATPPLADAQQSSAAPRLTFTGTVVHFDADLTAAFAVDSEARTITGMLMPYSGWGTTGGVKYRFAKGSLKFSDPSRVKLLLDHDGTKAIGFAKNLKDTPAGLMATFKVANGAAGDEALQLAQEGVLDGLSAGVEFDGRTDAVPDPKDRSAWLVTSAALREGSLTALPAFDDARLTQVNASLTTEGSQMTDPIEPTPAPAAPAVAPVTATFTAEQVQQMLTMLTNPTGGSTVPVPMQQMAPEPERPQVVNPTRSAVTFVREALPYRFMRDAQAGLQFQHGEHLFSQDLLEMSRANDQYGDRTDAGKRVMGMIQAGFATVSTDINELTPVIQRPDMFVDERQFRYPIWNSINKGAPPQGIQPFTFPKFASASGFVADHTEGVEPTPGSEVTTGQTVTPTPLSGKAQITREVWDMGGNPAVSSLIWNQMQRSYYKGLETAAGTFLNTLTAATDINLGVAVVDGALAAAWDAALVGLQYIADYDFSYFAVEQWLYTAFAAAKDTTGRKLFPMINPMNANGQATSRFAQLDVSGVVALPTWALTAVSGSANNSWLYDPSVVFGWATPPQRLDFPGASDNNQDFQPVAKVQIAIWGYKAFANSDIGGVRQVIYDNA